MFSPRSLLLCFSFVCASAGVLSFSESSEAQSRAEISHRQISQEGIGVSLALLPEPGWHVYWRYPGDSGATLKTKWACDGVAPQTGGNGLHPEAWPIPEVIAVGPLVNYGYDHGVALPFNVPCNVRETKTVTVDAEWLVCKEECIPQYATLELSNAERTTRSPALPTQIFPATKAVTVTGAVIAPSTGEHRARIDLSTLAGVTSGARFIPSSGGQIVNAAAQSFEGTSLEVTLASPNPSALAGLLVTSPEQAVPIAVDLVGTAENSPPVAPGWGLLSVAAAAFLGGVLLNVMPCVFPVLGLKIYQLVSASPRERRTNSVLYGIGVVVSMLALGGGIGLLRAQGVGVGWGTQLQNPSIVYALAVLFVLLGCNLLGVFEIGTGVQAAAGRIRASGPLMDGLLTVLVATPCTAPFMAGAVAVAFTLPISSQLLIFFFLGLGVAAPVLLIGTVPVLAPLIPKPGVWMERFKEFLAWPLFASAAWLLTVLVALVGTQSFSRPLFGVVLVGFLVWLFSVWRPSGVKKILFLLLSGLALHQFSPSLTQPSEPLVKHVPYTKEELARLRSAGTPVFLDATATWCITCQSNKALVLSSSEVVKRMQEKGVIWMEADWTEPNEAITALLGEFGRAGVPLNVFFPPGKDPVVFPPILTTTMVLEALAK
jgi:thiol:disulfide interchange protein